MRSIHLFFWIILLLSIENDVKAQNDSLHIDYFGQTPPGKHPVVFAPDFISRKDWWVQNCCFSPNGKEFVFCCTNKEWTSCVMYTKYTDGKWSEPDTLFEDALAPYFSYDGKHLYFILDKHSGNITSDVMVSARGANGWEKPKKIGIPVSSENGDEWEVCESGKGTLYFSSNRPGGLGGIDIYRAKLINNRYDRAENLGPIINTWSLDECPYISPDENYMIFNSWKDNPKYRGNNLYITFRKKDDTWSYPEDLGSIINTDYLDIYPYVSPDGKYFFYTIRTTCCSIGEPSSKLYWVSTEIFDSLKNDNSINCEKVIP